MHEKIHVRETVCMHECMKECMKVVRGVEYYVKRLSSGKGIHVRVVKQTTYMKEYMRERLYVGM